MLEHRHETKSRLLAKLARALLRDGYQTLADFTDALKSRCARLRICWTNDDLNEAYRLLGSNQPLPGDRQPPRRLVERPADPEVINRRDAATILATLQDRVGKVTLKGIPAVSRTRAFDRDRRKAAQMVAAEILDSVRRCEELERTE